MRFDSSGIPREGSEARRFGRRSDRCAALLLRDVDGDQVALLGRRLLEGILKGHDRSRQGMIRKSPRVADVLRRPDVRAAWHPVELGPAPRKSTRRLSTINKTLLAESASPDQHECGLS
jgi:hypothetical protein